MRHTQLLPRHVIHILNEIVKRPLVDLADGVSAGRRPTSSGCPRRGARSSTGSSRRTPTTSPARRGDEAIKNHAAVVQPQPAAPQLQPRERRARRHRLRRLPRCLPLDRRARDRDPGRPDDRYVVGEFAYTYAADVRPVEDEDSVCVHPLFMHRWFDAGVITEDGRQGRARRLPLRLRPDDDDMRSESVPTDAREPTAGRTTFPPSDETPLGISLQRRRDPLGDVLARRRTRASPSAASSSAPATCRRSPAACYLAAGVAISHAMSSARRARPAAVEPREPRGVAPATQPQLPRARRPGPLVAGRQPPLRPDHEPDAARPRRLRRASAGFVLQKLYPGIGHGDVDLSAADVGRRGDRRSAWRSPSSPWVGGASETRKAGREPLRFASRRRRRTCCSSAAAVIGRSSSCRRSCTLLAPVTSPTLLDTISASPAPLVRPSDPPGARRRRGRGRARSRGAVAARAPGADGSLRGALAAIAGGRGPAHPVHARDRDRRGEGVVLPRDGLMLIIATVVIVLFAILAHNRRYSMHLFYRERIQEAFALPPGSVRAAAKRRGVAEPIPYQQPIMLSDVAAEAEDEAQQGRAAFPELVDLRRRRRARLRGAEQDVGGELHVRGRALGQQRLGLHAPTTDVRGRRLDRWRRPHAPLDNGDLGSGTIADHGALHAARPSASSWR